MRTACVLVCVLAPFSAAMADNEALVGVEFGSLRGVLTIQSGGVGGTFTAGAVNEPGLLSYGRLWRSVTPTGEALFDTGFVSEPNPADATISLGLGAIQDKHADVNGTASFTDVDGDVVLFALTGTLTFGPEGRVSIVTAISGIGVTSDENLFDGTDGGSVSTDEFDDARGTMRINFAYPIMDTGGGRTRIGTADLLADARGPRGVPAPSTAGALLGAASMVLARRRRRAEMGGAPC